MSERTRPYRAQDAVAVREVHLRAFEGRSEESSLVERLHDAGATPVSLVAAAEPDGRVVGHVLFSPVRVDGRGSDPPMMVGRTRVGVLPEYQGRGIGSRLIREGLEACCQAGYGAAVVLSEPDYYSRFGFERASERGLGNEYGVDEHFMVAELRDGAFDGVGGTVRYRKEFREVRVETQIGANPCTVRGTGLCNGLPSPSVRPQVADFVTRLAAKAVTFGGRVLSRCAVLHPFRVRRV